MSLNYKYQQDYNTLTKTCPPADYSPQDIESVFRWVFDSMLDSKNFQSQYQKS